MEKFQPAPTFTIEDLETIKVIADPLRGQIVEMLVSEPNTINQIATKLGLAPSKLYYHVNLLEKVGLIKVVDTTQRGNIVEKHYWVTALDYRVDESLFNFSTPEGKQNISHLMLAPLETTRQDLLRSLEARTFNLEHGAESHPRQVMITRELSHISDEKAEEFMKRFNALAKEFSAADDPEIDADAPVYALTIAFYPTFYYEDTESE
ncbi:MAG: helix-turn-helix transcriptional regulator [Anaerolineales bacterium]|nr:helix-turn-helix transcriptional regulator [Chloroflexota bacterium]MBL6982168.1 helix-turn-helix transcriptional regulator [Anaerolineales bacterium]